MSTLSQFSGGAATRSIINFCSSGGVSLTNLTANASTNIGREVLSGSLTAGVLKTLLTISHGGRVPFLSVYSKNATSRTVRIVVIVDGVTVFDATSSAVTASGSGLWVAGQAISGANASEPIRFNSSLVVQVASSLTETDGVAIGYSLI